MTSQELESIKIEGSEESSKRQIFWTEQHEKILAEWADKAMCYRWLHSNAENKYSFLSRLFTIPVIILSTLTGTANFAIERVPEKYQGAVQVGIGTLNILAGVITTIQQFLKINELNESHRIAAISWGKFYRNIKTELLKNPTERYDVSYLVKTSKEEFDRLTETSPPIDSSIINRFYKKFKGSIDNISTPEICDSLKPTYSVIYRTPIDNIEKTETDKIVELIKQKQNAIDKEIKIEDFIKRFQAEYSRKPTIIEIYENLEETVNKEAIEKFITKSPWLRKKNNKSGTSSTSSGMNV
jgi:hypothetical protein